MITTLDRLGWSTQHMLAFAEALRGRGSGLRVLNVGGGDMDTATPMGSMVFTVIAALAQLELEIMWDRVTDPVAKRRAAGENLGGRRRRILADFQIRTALRLIEGGRLPLSVRSGVSAVGSSTGLFRSSRVLIRPGGASAERGYSDERDY